MEIIVFALIIMCFLVLWRVKQLQKALAAAEALTVEVLATGQKSLENCDEIYKAWQDAMSLLYKQKAQAARVHPKRVDVEQWMYALIAKYQGHGHRVGDADFEVDGPEHQMTAVYEAALSLWTGRGEYEEGFGFFLGYTREEVQSLDVFDRLMQGQDVIRPYRPSGSGDPRSQGEEPLPDPPPMGIKL